MKQLIENVKIVTMDENNTVIPNGFVLVENNKIHYVGTMNSLDINKKEWEIIDGKGGILMPGMINSHTHLAMIPFRGLEDDCVDRLRKFLIPMENKWVDKELVFAATKYALAESLLAGVTTVVDMYYFVEEMLMAGKEIGIRGFFGETIMEEKTCDFQTPELALNYLETVFQKWDSSEIVKPFVAPHATTTCSVKTLKSACEMAKKYNSFLSLHVAEMDYEMEYFKNSNYKTPIKFLVDEEISNCNIIAAHCINLTQEDVLLMKENNIKVSHCIGSNSKAAKGVSPITELVKNEVLVGLGTDGPASGNTLDILTQFKLVANFHKNATKNRNAWSAQEIISLGTINGAKILNLEKEIGSIEIGKKADLVLLETESANMFPVYDPHSTIVYSSNQSNVEHVWVNGKHLVKNKKLVNHNLSQLRENLLKIMEKTDFKIME